MLKAETSSLGAASHNEALRRLRISIRGLMALVLLFGIGFAAMQSGSDLCSREAYTLTVCVLLAAAIMARYRGAFWYGFAVAGWGYFLLGSAAWSGPVNRSPGQGTFNQMLLSSSLATYLCSYVPGFRTDGFSSLLQAQRCRNIEIICHSMLALIVASVGGLFARLIVSRDREEPSLDGPVCRARGDPGACNG
jgi:hypothetical protein